jgi:hypothetical protein
MPDQPVYNPVHYADEPCEADLTGGDVWKGPGWYFWTETQADRIGPFPTETEANLALEHYCETL